MKICRCRPVGWPIPLGFASINTIRVDQHHQIGPECFGIYFENIEDFPYRIFATVGHGEEDVFNIKLHVFSLHHELHCRIDYRACLVR